MKTNIKIISKIVSEITSFYLGNGVEDFHIKIDKKAEKNEYVIYTHGFTKLSEKRVDEMKKLMSVHHDMEYDEYWELMGEGEAADELILVARICDSVIIQYENGILEIILRKSI
ncbi:hypothetical protein EII29_05545 [Leptotrichia sp. OH3620_COT-345]|uniref:hypothetical protein n=1 Tax=Leptotrichia sp. OH3620_COT-345 TaxID=2491048 RepID=UPI000F64A590|nr:hypothetical protein [Leptotrichia sp. OH3620_COT-345]RRD39726.1 hypothetical protein EII29_05545 [Leptotrichia sp. OH3620_COT-345]